MREFAPAEVRGVSVEAREVVMQTLVPGVLVRHELPMPRDTRRVRLCVQDGPSGLSYAMCGIYIELVRCLLIGATNTNL